MPQRDIAQALDDILQFSLQKPVEQVSLLPFPGRIKSAALATLGGVLRPLAKATGGGIAFWAHVGGFVAGVVLIKLFAKPILTGAKREGRVLTRSELGRFGGW